MLNISRVALMLGAILLCLTGCEAGSGPSGTGAQGRPALTDADIVFLNRAGTAGLEEVTFARLAETKAGNPTVRSFATSMVADFTVLDQQNAALTQSKGLNPPSEMDERHAMLLQQLQPLNGVAFDRAYLDGQLQELTLIIQGFQREADSGSDTQVRSLAQQNLPMLTQQLRTASGIAGL